VTRWLAGGSGTTTYFIYDIAGRLAAEYSDGEPGDSGRSWVFTDMLGSVRAVTDDTGTVTECYDYLPFGWMLTEDENGRDGVGCYPDSPTSYTSEVGEKFTGQIREPVDLDYFIARYYSAGQGRFTSADLPFMDQWEEDPRSWNLYVYARNNPFLFVDPTGQEIWCVEAWEPTTGNAGECHTDDIDFSSWNMPCGLDFYIDGIYSGVTCDSGGWLEGLHTTLDVGGMTPVVGIFADLANAGIYLFEGKLWNSGISLAGALPFGQLATGGRLVRRGVNGLAARGGSALSKAGQALDRGGLTRAGRALEKHGGRPGSVFSRATGNVAAKNAQGQAALDDILGNVGRTSPNKFGGLDYFGGSRGGGARFDAQGNFIGFLEP
jgi:RHS repeat-associated protein